MSEQAELQNRCFLDESDQIIEKKAERLERQQSFRNKFAQIKYSCVLQIFSAIVLLLFLVVDTFFKIAQTHASLFLSVLVEKFRLNVTESNSKINES
jgi:hypothetical protein